MNTPAKEWVEEIRYIRVPNHIGPYTIVKPLGAGAWKQTYEAIREDGTRWALKFYSPTRRAREIATERGITKESFWKKECINGNTGSDHLTSHILENIGGYTFLAEELLDETLEDRLNRGYEWRNEEIIDIAVKLARGIAEFHERYQIPHGDIKPANIGFKGNKVKVFDYGTATVHLNQRGGKNSYRAPEVNDNDNRTRKYSYATDIWSYGAVLYRIITGEDIHRISSGSDDFNIEIKQQIDKIQNKDLKSVLEQCLNAWESARIQNGRELQEIVEDIPESRRIRYKILNRLSKLARPALKYLSIAVGSGLAGAGILYAMYQVEVNPEPPVNLELPVVSGRVPLQEYAYVEGFSTISNEEANEILKKREKRANQLPPLVFGMEELVTDGYDVALMAHGNELSRHTHNHYIATLIAAYENALVKNHEMRAKDISCCRNMSSELMRYIVTDYQFAMATPSPSETSGVEILTETLARGMTVLEQPTYVDSQLRTYVDLEDLLTVSLVGTTLMYQAREASGSKDFAGYVDAKNLEGQYIIPRETVGFLKDWIGYAHQSAVPAQDFQPLVISEQSP